MSIQNYVFIDGNYLRRAYEDCMRQFFVDVDHTTIDFAAIKHAVGASKAFFYDSVDDDAPDAAARRARLEFISSLDGFHVREGTLSRDKKRQKQVDVQLAVECLTHAFNKNVWHVTIVAGDLDFKPLVDSLVNIGVHVHVVYEKRSGARRLYRAADVAMAVDLKQFWEWSVPAFRREHPIPDELRNVGAGGEFLLKQGKWQERGVKLFEDRTKGEHLLHIQATADDYSRQLRFNDLPRLEKYFELMYGGIEWNQ